MESTVVQNEKVQAQDSKKDTTVGVFRWQKYVDGDGRLWIVVLTFGFDPIGNYGAMVELLNVDAESTIEITREEFETWVRTGTLNRCELPVMV